MAKKKEVKREKLAALGQLITDRIGVKVDESSPEYWGLDALVTDDMCDIALKMGVRKPKTFDEIMEFSTKSREETQKLLDEMAWVGLIEYNWENERHEKQYVLPMFVPGSAEFTNMRYSTMEEHPELADFFENMSRLPLEHVTPLVPMGGAGIGMHVIPVEKAIEMESESVSIEHISHWLDKYDGLYASSPCSCRYSRKIQGEGCADDPEGWCLAMGDMAKYIVETGRGEFITRERVYEILRKAEDNGFVHQITNIDGEDKIFAICNCNVNVCYALRTSQLFNTPNLSRSAYVASVKAENCVACGKCVENCPAGAVKLGQKLCLKNGEEVAYPKRPLPDNHKWGKRMWSPDYRNENRINCYDTGTAPCKTACPAHIAIQGYLQMAKEGRYDEALELIRKDNPFPAVCGKICNKRCEDACTRGTVDEAVSIDAVKDFLAQREIHSETKHIPKKVIPKYNGEFEEKVAIIGAGPAGLSAAYFLALKGYRPTVFEKHSESGGMLRYGIPSFKLSRDVIDAEIDVIKELGVEIKCGVEVGRDITIADLREQGYKGFYLAIGCQGGRAAGVPGEEGEGVVSAVSFLGDYAEGKISSLKGRTVVVGGGNVAADAARTAIRAGSKTVSLYSLEQREEMPASKDEISSVLSDGITVNNGWGPMRIERSAEGKVKGITFKRCSSVFDKEGKFSPSYDESETITAECDNVIMAIGQKVEWGTLLEGENVTLSRGGYPVVDPLTYQTAVPDIFAGGDLVTGPKFAIDAIAGAREGALSLHRFVQPRSSLTIGRNRRDFIELNKKNITVPKHEDTARQCPLVSDGSLSEEQVSKESSRCLSCGASVVDQNRCIGCGVCTTKCSFDAIHLNRVHPKASTMIKSEKKLGAIGKYAVKRGIKILFNPKRNPDPINPEYKSPDA